MCGWIGDPIEDLELCVFSDANWAGEKSTYKSTTDSFTCLIGPNSFFPISALSKKQTCVSHSTPEAEIVAAVYPLLAKQKVHPADQGLP